MTGPFKDLDFDAALAQLVASGFPTLEQFMSNPDKYRLQRYQLFESVDRSDLRSRKTLAKQKMYWRFGTQPIGFSEIERIVAENGYKIEDIEVMPYRDRNASGTGKDVIYVRFFPKTEIRLMGGVIPNDQAA